jgi:hypothetical protein
MADISGFSGFSGWSGWSGISGFSGATLLSGYSGFSGESGWSGISGFSGATLLSGYSGWSGLSGRSGFSGKSGWSGKSGYSAWSGRSGYSGQSGFSGATLLSGYSGWSGWSGWSGQSGRSGFSGFSGQTGCSGYSGKSGTSGWSGQRGTSGYSGSSGFSGLTLLSGYSGFSGVLAIPSVVQANNIAGQALSNGSYGDISFDTDEVASGFDIAHDPTGVSTPNDRFPVTTTGTYLVSYSVSVDSHAGVLARVRKNDVTVLTQSEVDSTFSGSDEIHSHAFAVSLVAGDFLTLQMQASSLGQVALGGKTHFMLQRIAAAQGESGRSGWSGWSAWSGQSGWSGWSGWSGYSGLSGYSGWSAWSGWSGTSGWSGGTPGGADTQVQFNDGGAFGGDAQLVWNKTTNTLTITGKLTVTGVIDPTELLLTGGNKKLGATDAGTLYLAPFSDSATAIQFRAAGANPTTDVILNVDTSSRNIGIGTGATTPSSRLHVEGNSAGYAVYINQTNASGSGLKIKPGHDSLPALTIRNVADNADKHLFGGDGTATVGKGSFTASGLAVTGAVSATTSLSASSATITAGLTAATLTATGALNGNTLTLGNSAIITNTLTATTLIATGAISGTSLSISGPKTFKIPHPRPDLAATKTLVYGCVEGPRLELLFRGRTYMCFGRALVNLDVDSNQSTGTFESLARSPQCWASSDESFATVKARVVGNLLSLESEDPDYRGDVSWLVIAERNDPTIRASGDMDEDGRFRVERENEV